MSWEHWQDVEDRWPGRTAVVARQLPTGARVLDLGAGAQGLRAFADDYTPADLGQRTPDTLLFDMNAGVWPTGRWDVVVLAGVLEYAIDPVDALWHAWQLAPVAIVTYAHRRSRKARELRIFRNELTPATFARAAWRAGYRKVVRVATWREGGAGAQVVWRLR